MEMVNKIPLLSQSVMWETSDDFENPLERILLTSTGIDAKELWMDELTILDMKFV